MRKVDPPFLTVLFAVFACGALVSDDPRVYEEGGYSDDSRSYPVEQGPLDPFAQWQNDLLNGDSRVGSDGNSQRQARTSTFNFGLSDAARRQGVRRAGHRYYAQVNILILHSLFQPSVDQAVLYGLMACVSFLPFFYQFYRLTHLTCVSGITTSAVTLRLEHGYSLDRPYVWQS